jgi:hypothetical protein
MHVPPGIDGLPELGDKVRGLRFCFGSPVTERLGVLHDLVLERASPAAHVLGRTRSAEGLRQFADRRRDLVNAWVHDTTAKMRVYVGGLLGAVIQRRFQRGPIRCQAKNRRSKHLNGVVFDHDDPP